MSAPATLQARRAMAGAGCDRLLMMSVAALLSAGIVMVHSASIATDSATLDTNFRHLLRQLLHIALGLALLALGALIKLEWLQRASRVLLLAGLALLVAVLVPSVGVEVGGSLRWLEVGGVRVQPSEAVKIAAVIYFADYFARKQGDLHRFKVGVINVGLVTGVIGFLLLMEPDFGATTVIAASVAGMMFLAGVRFWHFCASVSVAGALMSALVWMEPYRVKRLLAHRDPWADPFDGGFQLVQALIAIGRGEWLGAGLGNSTQKLFYLPHAGTDFLIAVIAEELGAIGIFAVLLLYAVLLWRAFVIARRGLDQGHRFAGFLAQGIGLLLALQAVIHIGVNTGLLPTKGLTLPLMSYGGSSMLSSMAAIGLLFAVDRHTRPRPPQSSKTPGPKGRGAT
ncbi:MAG: putative lipid II flippase FtsW [Gammaproteobacteria bacterium]|nr:putative lipid II flippase FtsW [Gammaproteobacteria bacterium]